MECEVHETESMAKGSRLEGCLKVTGLVEVYLSEKPYI